MSKTEYRPFGATLFSRGLYSSWCYIPRYELLFDCGEGCSLHLGNDVVNVRKIFIGHTHSDHVLGLLSLIGIRNTVRGTSRNPKTRDHNKPLEIYYPMGDTTMKVIIDFCENRYRDWLRYDLSWIAVPPGAEIEIAKNTYVKAFEMLHPNDLTLGFVIRENRKRLKQELVGKDIQALLKSGQIEKGSQYETYTANLFAYCLDAADIDCNGLLVDCEYAVMDCTFLKKEDRGDPTHLTLDESLTFCHNNGVKNMIAAHVSPRYDGVPTTGSFSSEITSVHTIDPMTPNFI